MKKLTIVQIAPLEESVPPQKYGGTELVISNITEELTKRGHTVYLMASGDSKTSAKLIPIFEKGMRNESYGADMKMRDSLKFVAAGRILGELNKIPCDIVHNHLGWRLLPFSQLITSPVVTTLHGPLDTPYQQAVYNLAKDQAYVSISNNQQKGNKALNYIDTVYNGIDINEFEFINTRGKYFAFLGRTSPEKGIKQAVMAAKSTGVQLKIAAKVDIVDKEFFEKEVQPFIDGKQIQFLGEIEPNQKSEFLGNAIATLAPIQWEEPFGLVFTESMACGTPVISVKRGSAPEVIADQETGFLSEPGDMNGLIDTINQIVAMPEPQYQRMRQACRKRVESYFTIEKMVDGYEAVYKKVLHDRGL